ncbi:MAG TPA: ATPase, T2SS/T4P/T4SS family, partial [Kofleriaceae bacterium]
MTSIAALLRFAVQQGASDLHLSAGEPPMMRVHGDMFRVDLPALTAEDTHRLVFDVMTDAQRKAFQDKLECDFAFPLDDKLRFRVNVFVQNRGEAAVFRTIPSKIPRFDDLGLPAVVHQLCDEEKGLVLVTGPTGSGKSTTLAAMIDYLNETMAGHILTLEDPIEFVHAPKRSMVNQREIG